MIVLYNFLKKKTYTKILKDNQSLV